VSDGNLLAFLIGAFIGLSVAICLLTPQKS